MNQKIKVSAVVPICRQENFLRTCVDSICAQTLREIEIILVEAGSVGNSSTLCDEYAAKDSRVRVIHTQNAGLAEAYNTGIAAAKGEYVGFVEPDDWIESKMYKELYAKATEEDVDVVKGLYFAFNYDTRTRVAVADVGGKNSLYRRINDPWEVPNFVVQHLSFWSAIYRRKLLEQANVRFLPTPDDTMQGLGFVCQVFSCMESFYIFPNAYYVHRTYNMGSHNEGGSGYGTALNAYRSRRECYDKLRNQTIDPRLYELLFIEAFRNFFLNYNRNCNLWEKLLYTRMFSSTWKKQTTNFKLDGLNRAEQELARFLIPHPILFVIKDFIIRRKTQKNHSFTRVLGIKLFEQERKANTLCKRFIGIPYTQEVCAGAVTKIYHFGIRCASRETIGEREVSRILGIRYKTKTIPRSHPPFAEDMRTIQIVAQANAITHTHRETFLKYKGCHCGKDVVLFASGPTLNYFEPLEGSISVGVNKTCAFDKVHFDYLFFHDYCHPQAREIFKLFNLYKGAKKFYGIVLDYGRHDWIVPESYAIRDKAERYYVIPHWKFPPVRLTYDIAHEPLSCPGSISFAAMQFILWTNPRRVYLVGHDVSASYFDGSISQTTSDAIYCITQGWIKIEEFRKIYYPETEIISVNPVGLRGMFKDMYTRSYLAAHPKLKVKAECIMGHPARLSETKG